MISKDQRGFNQLCMKRNNERFNQTSLYCLQSWRANCDIQIIGYDTDPKNPDLSEIAKFPIMSLTMLVKAIQLYPLKKKM